MQGLSRRLCNPEIMMSCKCEGGRRARTLALGAKFVRHSQFKGTFVHFVAFLFLSLSCPFLSLLFFILFCTYSFPSISDFSQLYPLFCLCQVFVFLFVLEVLESYLNFWNFKHGCPIYPILAFLPIFTMANLASEKVSDKESPQKVN